MDVQQGFLVGVILVVGALSLWLFAPFSGYVIAAAMLAYLLQPVQHRLTEYVRPSVAALIVTLLTVLVAIIPVGIMGVAVLKGGGDLLRQIQSGDIVFVEQANQWLAGVLGENIQLEEQVDAALAELPSLLADSAGELVGSVIELGIGLSLMVFLQYYLVRDGEKFVAWTKQFDVMPTDMQDQLYTETGEMTVAVVKGYVAVALIQGLVAGLGLFIAGIPNAAFWTFVMILLGFIPIIESAGVWMPASLYLVLTGEPIPGAFLFFWGVVVVGTSENYIRPVIIEHRMRLHEAVILVGVVGGLAVFGPIGLFIGPILLGMLQTLLELFEQHYQEI